MQENKTAQFAFRSSPEIREMLRELATHNARTMNGEFTSLIKAAYKRMKKEQQNDAA